MNTQIFPIEHTLIRISTRGSLTSLVNLHNGFEELNLGLLRTNQSMDKGFEPGTSRSLVEHLKPLGHATSSILSNTVKPVL